MGKLPSTEKEKSKELYENSNIYFLAKVKMS